MYKRALKASNATELTPDEEAYLQSTETLDVSSELLKESLQKDFDRWIKTDGKIFKTAEFRKKLVPKSKMSKTFPYHAWSTYQCGNAMYGKLCANIHNYNDSYEIRDGTWLNHDKVILQWLKPEIGPSDKKMHWYEERRKRDLPRTEPEKEV